MIDLHCHLDLYPNPQAVISTLINKGVYVLSVTTTPRSFPTMRRMIGNASRIRLGLGLHPELVEERHSEVDLFPMLLSETNYVGEIGIDGSPAHKHSIPLQKRTFCKILKYCSDVGGRFLSIHSRGAAGHVLDCLEREPQAGIPIFHWFSGSTKELERAFTLGAWFSVGSSMLCSKKGMQLASLMPINRVLTETDGPFARNGDNPLYPWDVCQAEDKLAKLWILNKIQCKKVLHSNFTSLLALQKNNIKNTNDCFSK